ncbi:hypothetical protein [Marinospirillum celere]|uniref:hypothetical protein n=1 Tax=Marinospirillum celere TaxID=1122252 RepID=UPI0011603DC1|nr:hypothetical protein [Marinospirillum celere]
MALNLQVGKNTFGSLTAFPDGGDDQVGAAHPIATGKDFFIAGLEGVAGFYRSVLVGLRVVCLPLGIQIITNKVMFCRPMSCASLISGLH